jgi:hypothetical protein
MGMSVNTVGFDEILLINAMKPGIFFGLRRANDRRRVGKVIVVIFHANDQKALNGLVFVLNRVTQCDCWDSAAPNALMISHGRSGRKGRRCHPRRHKGKSEKAKLHLCNGCLNTIGRRNGKKEKTKQSVLQGLFLCLFVNPPLGSN